MAKPLRGREQGTEWRANLNKGRSHPWRKSNKHRGKNGQTHQQQKEGRGIAARAQREGAAPGGSTKQTKQKHDPSHDVERHTEGRAAPQKGRPHPLQEKSTGGDKRKAHQQTEGSRAKNRRASKAQRSGARRKSQQPHKRKHDPSYSVGGNWGRDGEQT